MNPSFLLALIVLGGIAWFIGEDTVVKVIQFIWLASWVIGPILIILVVTGAIAP